MTEAVETLWVGLCTEAGEATMIPRLPVMITRTTRAICVTFAAPREFEAGTLQWVALYPHPRASVPKWFSEIPQEAPHLKKGMTFRIVVTFPSRVQHG